MSYVPAWVSGITTCWVVCGWRSRGGQVRAGDRNALVADVELASLERGEVGGNRDVLAGRQSELVIEALAVGDRARDRAAERRAWAA